MSKKAKTNLVYIGLGLVGLGIALVSYRKCNRGCQSLAQHLIEHGVSDIVLGLF